MQRQDYQIVPAQDLMQLRYNLQIVDGLSKNNMKFHVELHKRAIDNLINWLGFGFSPKGSFFIAGQRGNGKTTLVDYVLCQSEIEANFHVIGLDLHELTNIDDENFDVVEIMVLIMTEILQRSPSVQEIYKTKVEKIKDALLTQYQDTAQNQWGFKDFLLELLANTPFGLGMRIDASRRVTIRQTVRPNLKELRTLLDTILLEYASTLGDKRLILFLDGLDKITRVEAIKSVFSQENAHVLSEIGVRKIIMSPLMAMYESSASLAALGHLEILNWRIRNNPLGNDHNSKLDPEAQEHFELLEKIIRVRIHPDHQHLIEADAMQYIIQQTGGLTRHLFKLMEDTIRDSQIAKSPVVRKQYAQKAKEIFGNNLSMRFTLDAGRIRILYHILQNHKLPIDKNESEEQNKVLSLLLESLVVYNTNGEPFYFVNPLVENIVRTYGESFERNITAQ